MLREEKLCGNFTRKLRKTIEKKKRNNIQYTLVKIFKFTKIDGG